MYFVLQVTAGVWEREAEVVWAVEHKNNSMAVQTLP